MGQMGAYSKTYQNPLLERYAGARMLYIFSPEHKYLLWRDLWIALARAQKELGLSVISEEHLQEMKKMREIFDPAVALEHEKRLKHDVMAQIEAFGELAPQARKILHLGATSAFVGDNADLVQMKFGLLEIRASLLEFLKLLRDFCEQHKDLPTLGYTHFQAAQLTTVGKRAALWLQSFVKDFEGLEDCIEKLEFLGVKGTTGTQASFADLFDRDFQKTRDLDVMVAQSMGFSRVQALSGQTYDRKTDHRILSVLSGIAQSAHKMTNDLRLLQHLKEFEEPFSDEQIGSSAMAYKRNPIYAERVASLCKFLLSLSWNPPLVASTQWFERTLDDSANRRLALPESFLAMDGILHLLQRIVKGIRIYPAIIERHVREELPFMATEHLLMMAVKKGMDRQEAHKILRDLSMEEVREIKEFGKENRLLERIAQDGRLGFSQKDLDQILEPHQFVGFAKEQVEAYLREVVDPMLSSRDASSRPSLPHGLDNAPPAL